MSFKVRRFDDEQKAETAYLTALQRLVDGEPAQQKTKALMRSGTLSVCQQHVAWEAGRSSRTPISGDDSAWPRVRDEIERAKSHAAATAKGEPDPGERDARKQLSGLRARISELLKKVRILTAERDLAYGKVAALILIVEELKRERLVPITSEDERLAARRAAEERVVAG